MSTDTDLQSIKSSIATLDGMTELEVFKPNAGGQEAAAKSTAKELIIAGGNSSGKSYIAMTKAGWHIVAEEDKDGRLTGRTIHPYLDLRIPQIGVQGWISSISKEAQIDFLHELVDRILKPYIIDDRWEEGAYREILFKGVYQPSRIVFKWVTQGLRSYAGPKKNFVYLDEPHPKATYREAYARTFRSDGYLWIALTPIVDETNWTSVKDIIWMRDEIIEPYTRDPDAFPETQVVYIDVEENAAHVPVESILKKMASMSTRERITRKTGSFIVYAGKNCFNTEMLQDILDYLIAHPEESTPEYGGIMYSESESDKWKFEFVPNRRADFPDIPESEWALKVWERHVDGKGSQLCPGYTIACDVAEGVPGGDFTNAYVFRNDTKRIVAALHGHITEEELAYQLWLLGHYYNDGDIERPAKLGIEIRTYGASTQRYLINGNSDFGIPKYPYHRFYFRPSNSNIEKGQGYAYAPGWDTNAKTRRFVITSMREALSLAHRAIEEGYLCPIPDIGAIKEGRGFVQDKHGKYTGNPDDRLFALGIGHFILTGGRYEHNFPSPPAEVDEPEMDGNFYLKQRESGLYVPAFNHQAVLDELKRPSRAINF